MPYGIIGFQCWTDVPAHSTLPPPPWRMEKSNFKLSDISWGWKRIVDRKRWSWNEFLERADRGDFQKFNALHPFAAFNIFPPFEKQSSALFCALSIHSNPFHLNNDDSESWNLVYFGESSNQSALVTTFYPPNASWRASNVLKTPSELRSLSGVCN